jgi:Initiator Replication protein
MTVEELRAWLGIKRGEYEQTFHVRAAIIERAKEELDEVADVSFRYDPVMEGKRVTGWDFIPVPNKPKRKALPGKRRAKKREEKETAETAENGTAILEDLNRIDSLWLAADAVQREEWLKAIPEEARVFAPRRGRATEPVVSGGAQECFGTRFARVQLEWQIGLAVDSGGYGLLP